MIYTKCQAAARRQQPGAASSRGRSPGILYTSCIPCICLYIFGHILIHMDIFWVYILTTFSVWLRHRVLHGPRPCVHQAAARRRQPGAAPSRGRSHGILHMSCISCIYLVNSWTYFGTYGYMLGIYFWNFFGMVTPQCHIWPKAMCSVKT